ncbi:MAG TPA: NYN domain-containing protein [Anaerolineae bacterium]|nr:NYN domain-containing protein [Anaerolineae bacterium]
MQESQVAVFIDFENVAITAEEVYGKCDLKVIMNAAEQWGRCTIRRAYCDWTSFPQYQQDLIEHSIELTQLFRYSARHRKNAADIQMVVDALEVAFTHPEIDTFVLVTGDSDFSAVARKLRTYGKTVVGIGLRQSTSEVLVKACDNFTLYDVLVTPETRTATHRLERARLLLLGAMRTLLPQVGGESVNASQLKLMMVKMDSTFSETDLGYRQFRDFLESQSDLIQVFVEDKTLMAALKPTATIEPVQDQLLEYRVVLSATGLRLMDPPARTSILRDLFTLLSEHPDLYTLDQAVGQLKAKYDADNVLRSREEVQEVAKLVKYANVFAIAPQSWQLDKLNLQPDLQISDFVDYSESAYLVALMQQNIEINPGLLALLIFGTMDQQARVVRLLELALKSRALDSQANRKARAALGDWGGYLKEIPEMLPITQDLDAAVLDEPPSLARAAELSDIGMRIRTTDFEKARLCFLRAARMMCELMETTEPGASLVDLEWYLTSYCAATAGAYFFRFEYDRAQTYYLAFFALARETEPVWEKVQRLVEPLTSFYFTIAANLYHELLEHPPGRTHPARIAVALYTHTNPAVREKWLAQAHALKKTNPAVLRIVLQRFDYLERTAEVPGARATRQALEEILAED